VIVVISVLCSLVSSVCSWSLQIGCWYCLGLCTCFFLHIFSFLSALLDDRYLYCQLVPVTISEVRHKWDDCPEFPATQCPGYSSGLVSGHYCDLLCQTVIAMTLLFFHFGLLCCCVYTLVFEYIHSSSVLEPTILIMHAISMTGLGWDGNGCYAKRLFYMYCMWICTARYFVRIIMRHATCSYCHTQL